MEGNPYSAFINGIRADASGRKPASYRIGAVASGSPLSVDVGGNVHGIDSLVLATFAQGVEVEVDNTAIGYSQGADPHTHAARVAWGKPVFAPGDKLLLLPIEEEQRYIILARLTDL
jgi:hypothetical protein